MSQVRKMIGSFALSARPSLEASMTPWQRLLACLNLNLHAKVYSADESDFLLVFHM